MKTDTVLVLQHVTSGYGKIEVIRNVTFSVAQGQIVTLLGSNGVGKSTTLRTITGQLRLSGGSIVFKGQDISHLPSYKIAALGIGYSPEGRRVFGNLTVLENLRVGAYRVKAHKEFQQNLEWIFTLFPILRERSGQIAESLSGGEQQMLAIARALICKPELLLLDEPSIGLAPLVMQLIADTLREINKSGVSILLIEQNAKLALDISQFAFIMDKGSVVAQGKADQLADNPKIRDIYLGFA